MKERDYEWAKAKLLEFREALGNVEAIRSAMGTGGYSPETVRAAYEQANRLLPVALEIIHGLLPVQMDRSVPLHTRGVARQYIDVVDQALGAIDSHEELQEHWPEEPTATLQASEIHAWVWDPARDLWEIGSYKEALHSAAVTVNARLQAKVERNDLEFVNLARNAFSIKDPEPGQLRLRLTVPEEWGEEAWKDFHIGAATLGEAVFRLWRNLPSHKEYEIEEHPATEALGALSAFARMVDEAEVVLSVASEAEPSG